MLRQCIRPTLVRSIRMPTNSLALRPLSTVTATGRWALACKLPARTAVRLPCSVAWYHASSIRSHSSSHSSPSGSSGSSKLCASAAEAVVKAGLRDDATLLVGGFGLCGIPMAAIEAVRDSGAKNLTVVRYLHWMHCCARNFSSSWLCGMT